MALGMQSRDQRALLALVVAVALYALLQMDLFQPSTAAVAPAGSVEAAEEALLMAQVKARQKPLAEAERAAAGAHLERLERGLLGSGSGALAQAEMQELIGALLSAEGITMRGSRFGPIRVQEGAYAEIPISVDFICGIEQFINLMSAIANAPQLLATSELNIIPANPETKAVRVRLTVAGYLPADRAAEREQAGAAGGGL